MEREADKGRAVRGLVHLPAEDPDQFSLTLAAPLSLSALANTRSTIAISRCRAGRVQERVRGKLVEEVKAARSVSAASRRFSWWQLQPVEVLDCSDARLDVLVAPDLELALLGLELRRARREEKGQRRTPAESGLSEKGRTKGMPSRSKISRSLLTSLSVPGLKPLGFCGRVDLGQLRPEWAQNELEHVPHLPPSTAGWNESQESCSRSERGSRDAPPRPSRTRSSTSPSAWPCAAGAS